MTRLHALTKCASGGKDGGGGKGGGGRGISSHPGQGGSNWSSKSGNPSGGGRGNGPSKDGK